MYEEEEKEEEGDIKMGGDDDLEIPLEDGDADFGSDDPDNQYH